jgi:holo-[acyl-carrier protein] synthase
MRVYEKYGARFLNKILTETEKIYVLSKLSKGAPDKTHRLTEVLAGRFAAKEAVAKALGTGWRGIHWHDVEIINAESGAPYAVLHGRAQELLARLGCQCIEISLSHEREYALAVALLY